MSQEDRCTLCVSFLLSGQGRCPVCPMRGSCRLWGAVRPNK
jgi:hypothetical protein